MLLKLSLALYAMKFYPLLVLWIWISAQVPVAISLKFEPQHFHHQVHV